MKKTQTEIYSNHSKNKKPIRGLKKKQKAELAHRPLIIRNCFLDHEWPAPWCHPCSKEVCDQGAKATRLHSRRTFLFLAKKGPRQHTESSALWALLESSSLEAGCLEDVQPIFKAQKQCTQVPALESHLSTKGE